MRAAGGQPFQPLLPAPVCLGREPVPDGGDGLAVSGHPLLRIETDEGLAGEAGRTGEPEAGTAADAGHGVAGHLPAAQHQPPVAVEPGLSLPAEECQDHPAQPEPAPAKAGGEPVHQPGVHPGPQGARGEDQHGREGAVPGQHLRGAAVADGEVRRGVPESLRQRPGGPEGLEDYFRFYNGLRPHEALGYRTPAEVFHGEQGPVGGDSNGRRGSPGQGIESLKGEPGFSLNSPLILSK